MEDFIYILIGLIWLVFSVIKGTQKKKVTNSEKPANPSQQPRGRSFEDILSEILGEEPQPTAREVQYSEAVAAEETDEPEVGGAYQTLEDLYLKERNEQVKKVEILQEKPVSQYSEPQFLEESSIPNAFDLRKAIIYQTILERRYV